MENKNIFNKRTVRLVFNALIIFCSFLSCVSLKDVKEVDFNYFEKYRKEGERLVYISPDVDFRFSSNTISNFFKYHFLWIITNPDDIEKARSTVRDMYYNEGFIVSNINSSLQEYDPVYLTNVWGKGVAVFSLPRNMNEIYLCYSVHSSEYDSTYTIRWIYSINDEVNDFLLRPTFYVEEKDGQKQVKFIEITTWDKNEIKKSFDSLNGKYGYYFSGKKKKQGQFGFIDINAR